MITVTVVTNSTSHRLACHACGKFKLTVDRVDLWALAGAKGRRRCARRGASEILSYYTASDTLDSETSAISSVRLAIAESNINTYIDLLRTTINISRIATDLLNALVVNIVGRASNTISLH